MDKLSLNQRKATDIVIRGATGKPRSSQSFKWDRSPRPHLNLASKRQSENGVAEVLAKSG